MPAQLRDAFKFTAKLLLAIEEGANVHRYQGRQLVIPHPRFSLHLRKQEIAIKGDTVAWTFFSAPVRLKCLLSCASC